MKASEAALRAPVIVGPGRVGRSLAAALGGEGGAVDLRDRTSSLDDLAGRVVLLSVPDAAVSEVAGRIGASGEAPSLIGHTSGATTLDALRGAAADGCFSIHPLQTVPDGSTDLAGCPAAVAGSGPEALDAAVRLAEVAGMAPFEVSETDRATYHAAASIASNFLVTIEETAAELLGGIAVENPREVLEPLVRRSLDNWLERGPQALTGPIARGDEATVAAHRDALLERRSELVPFYDALADRTRQIAGNGRSAEGAPR
ncbi:MAG: DUF2520 domain-containing protein [Solirubrobacterales bacterium]|nr:DUF2520 domain-containing protein [Solirubrobacterales bacterium]HRV59252.1 DUF2520 domain-containing protein [Solirubrobacterales bacterium]